MNFTTTREFIDLFLESLIEYENKYSQTPKQAYIPFEDFDKLAGVVKTDPYLDARTSWEFYLSMTRFHYIDIYGVRCFRAYLGTLSFSTPERPEYGMYLGKP